MKRRIQNILQKADKQENRRSIIIYGMKGTGKTYSVLDHVKANYEEYLYIDAVHDDAFNMEFNKYYSDKADDPVTYFFSSFFKLDPEYLVNIPIILDEPPVMMLERHIFDNYNGELKLYIITASKEKAYEFAKVLDAEESTFRMYPMDFGEFLTALDKEWYDEVITGHIQSKRKIPDMIHEELMDLFGLYETLGGMPEVINEYIIQGMSENIRQRQQTVRDAILYRMIQDCTDDAVKSRIQNVWDAVELVLKKDNRKFMYSAIRDGATRREYKPVIDYICDQGMCIKVPETYKTGIKDKDGFRLYLADIGMYEKKEVNTVRENLLIQNIISSGTNVQYWESGKGASVSIIVDRGGMKIPVELKTSGKSNLRSVKSYMKENMLDKFISLQDENIKDTENGPVIPVYACHLIGSLDF
ncbi:MAG: ATP-binding protein [Lachnospiraceae bacterium]|nr:ATP-binding protein [Lachnospiraceae bacterium]